MLRFEAGRDPLNRDLTALIGELSMLSPQFREDWADQDVHEHRTGQKVDRHPEVGEVEITYDVFEMPGEPGLSIGTYSVEAGSKSASKFALLASWAATQELGTQHHADAAHLGERLNHRPSPPVPCSIHAARSSRLVQQRRSTKADRWAAAASPGGPRAGTS